LTQRSAEAFSSTLAAASAARQHSSTNGRGCAPSEIGVAPTVVAPQINRAGETDRSPKAGEVGPVKLLARKESRATLVILPEVSHC
jgi:hypothetical protein